MKIYSSFIALFIYGLFSAQKIWSFNDCLAYAQENNLQVVASRLNEQIQEENYKISKREKLPDVVGAVNNSINFAPKVKYQIFGNKDNYTGAYNNDLSLSSSILLYNNGKLKTNEEKNELLLRQNRFITERIQKDISLQLVGNYLTILLNKELQEVNKNNLKNNQDQADRNQKLYNAGSIPKSTLYEARANLANAKQIYETSIIEVDRSLLSLAILLQKDYEDFQIEDVKVSDDISMPLLNVGEVIDYAYNNQPEIKSSELGIEASKKDIDLAKSTLYPTITGGYKLGTTYTDLFEVKDKSLSKQWYDNHDHIFTVGVNIPIFNKGISKLKIEQARIQQKIQENDLDQQKLSLKQAIQTSYFDVNSAYQTFISAKETVESTKLSYDAAQKSFDAARLNVYDLNIARNNYYNALSQMLQAKYSFLFRLKVLDYYAGKPLEISNNNSTSTVSSSKLLNSTLEKTPMQEERISDLSSKTSNDILSEKPLVETEVTYRNSSKVDVDDDKSVQSEADLDNFSEDSQETLEYMPVKQETNLNNSSEDSMNSLEDLSENSKKDDRIISESNKIDNSDLFKEGLSEEERKRRKAIFELREKRKAKERQQMEQNIQSLFKTNK